MPLVPAICTHCGAQLNVNSEKDAAICSYCGSAFIVEKAINNYNTTNNITNNIRDSVVHIHNSNCNEFENLKNRALTFEKLGQDYNAAGVWKALTNSYPNNFEAWLGYLGYAHIDAADEFFTAYNAIVKLKGTLDFNTLNRIKEKTLYNLNSIRHCSPDEEQWKILISIFDEDMPKYKKITSELLYGKLNVDELKVVNYLILLEHRNVKTEYVRLKMQKSYHKEYEDKGLFCINEKLTLPCVIGNNLFYLGTDETRHRDRGISYIRIDSFSKIVNEVIEARNLIENRQCIYCEKTLNFFEGGMYCKKCKKSHFL